MKFLKEALIALVAVIIFLASPLTAFAVTIAEQTQNFGNRLDVWQVIQELGDNLSGTVGKLTFRVSTVQPNGLQFNYTAENTRIYDQTLNNNTSGIIGCLPSDYQYRPNDYTRGLTFNTVGIPAGYQDVTVDFSCRNYQFIPGHKYLIKISNANLPGFGGFLIRFAATAYGSEGEQTIDRFTNGGLRYAHGNWWDILHGGGSCHPIDYIWNDPIRNPTSGCNIWTTPKDDLYFIFTDNSPPSPPAPEPFLDLPWDYEGKELSFNEAANSMTSYFDHTYPLLSSGLTEITSVLNQVTTFENENSTTKNYSSHDGYDYAKIAKVNLGDPVLAAADGCAFYMQIANLDDPQNPNHVIKINHSNGYQTRYLHLNNDEYLITKSTTNCVTVTKGQRIGTVWYSGRVFPTGPDGAHIHFMVVQDKNNDGNFEDNILDGVTDPFGWQSKEVDPWENYTFFYNGQNRTGNKSYYLWTKKLDNLDSTLTSNEGVFQISRATINFPAGSVNQNLNINLQSSPMIKVNNVLSSIGSTIIATARDALGNLVTDFQNFFTITINFSNFDLSRYKTDTISIYSSSDNINWTKESTTINWTEETASAQLNHFSYFALMAERADTIPPETTPILNGQQGQSNWFRSDTEVIIDAKDNEEGLGIDYTLYRINGGEWQQYTSQLNFTDEGHYKLEFFSADNDENIEEIKTLEFDIDKTLPEVSIDINPKTLWPPNGELVDITVTGNSSDSNLYSTNISVDDEYNLVVPIISNFGQTIQLEAKRDGGDLDGRMYIIKAVAEDLAGNTSEKQTEVVVPHDQR